MRSMGQNPEWSIVTELKKQYDVSSVSPDAPIPADLDVLLVAQPSSLTQKQIDNLTAYVSKGGPTLLFLDPLPVDNPSISPEVPKHAARAARSAAARRPSRRGTSSPLLDLLGIDWPTTEIVWNPYNPHPQLADLPREFVFIGRGSGAADAFNDDEIVTSGLQEVVLLFPGLLRGRRAARPRVHPAAPDQHARAGRSAGTRSSPAEFMGVDASTRTARTSPPARPTPWPPGSRARPPAEPDTPRTRPRRTPRRRTQKPGRDSTRSRSPTST